MTTGRDLGMEHRDPREDVVAEILLRACEGPKGQMRPWKPFDLHAVARQILAALADAAQER
jgi:hypothetical protein